MAAARKSTAPGMDVPVMNDTAPISIFKETRKRTPKAKIAEAVVEEAPVVEEAVVEEAPVVEATPEPEVKTRRCPSHSMFFDEESEQRPMSEFRFNKTTGKLQGTYCARCGNKRHSMYSEEQRAEKRGPSVQDQLNEALMRIDDLQAQIEELEARNTQLEAERQTA